MAIIKLLGSIYKLQIQRYILFYHLSVVKFEQKVEYKYTPINTFGNPKNYIMIKLTIHLTS